MSSILVKIAPPGHAPGTLARARYITLLWMATTFWTSLVMPGIGVFHETRVWPVVSGSVGIVTVTIALGGVLYAAVTPSLSGRARRWWAVSFLAASLASLPLVAPLAAERWDTWAWLAASIIGATPLLLRPGWAAVSTVACTATSAAVAAAVGGSAQDAAIITGLIGASVAGVNWAPAWLWTLLAQAEAGRLAQARLAASEERLRFARDVHDLLGHNLTVIALKAELAARLTADDQDAARAEAEHIQRIAASALREMREVVHHYRRVDLAEQLDAAPRVLRSAGIGCTIEGSPAGVPSEAASLLAPVLREAMTNVLRHSRATLCTIVIANGPDEITLTVRNDGATGPAADPHSSGLRGLADRLAEFDGRLTTRRDGTQFTLAATVPSPGSGRP